MTQEFGYHSREPLKLVSKPWHIYVLASSYCLEVVVHLQFAQVTSNPVHRFWAASYPTLVIPSTVSLRPPTPPRSIIIHRIICLLQVTKLFLLVSVSHPPSSHRPAHFAINKSP